MVRSDKTAQLLLLLLLLMMQLFYISGIQQQFSVYPHLFFQAAEEPWPADQRDRRRAQHDIQAQQRCRRRGSFRWLHHRALLLAPL